VETFRTPEEHRARIQSVAEVVKPGAVKKAKPRKLRKKRAKRADVKADGTSSLQARLHVLGYRVYVDYLASPHWLDVKARHPTCSRAGCVTQSAATARTGFRFTIGHMPVLAPKRSAT